LLPQDSGIHERSGELRVLTPWGAEGWLSQLDVERPQPSDFASEIQRSATQMLGTPYRWGGRSPGGWDCSGFTQHCFAMAGLSLPRDAAQQARCGDALSGGAESWQAADLLFFGEPADHVGIYDGKGALLHASGRVRRQPIDQLGQLMGRLSGVRRLKAAAKRPATTLWR
jgi:cell wall-associated NlpC family hydrolase